MRKVPLTFVNHLMDLLPAEFSKKNWSLQDILEEISIKPMKLNQNFAGFSDLCVADLSRLSCTLLCNFEDRFEFEELDFPRSVGLDIRYRSRVQTQNLVLQQFLCFSDSF